MPSVYQNELKIIKKKGKKVALTNYILWIIVLFPRKQSEEQGNSAVIPF